MITPRLWLMKRTVVPNSLRSAGDEVEHLRLDGRVEAGRRLVEDQQRRVVRQRHRDHDALLHAARELVGVAAHDRDPGRRSGPASSISRARSRLASRRPRMRNTSATCVPTRIDGIQRRRRGSGRPSRPGSARAPDFSSRSSQSRSRRRRGWSPSYPAVAREVADDRERRGRLAAAGLADEAVRLAACST